MNAGIVHFGDGGIYCKGNVHLHIRNANEQVDKFFCEISATLCTYFRVQFVDLTVSVTISVTNKNPKKNDVEGNIFASSKNPE